MRRDLLEVFVRNCFVDLEFEVLALSYRTDSGVPGPTQGRQDGLALRIEDLGLDDDIDCHARHGGGPFCRFVNPPSLSALAMIIVCGPSGSNPAHQGPETVIMWIADRREGGSRQSWAMRALPDSAKAMIARQDGVLSRKQAVSQGLTPSQIKTRLARGDWKRLHPGVFFSTEHPMTPVATVRAAVLWAGPDAHLSGSAAAWWWRLTDLVPSRVEVITPVASHRRGQPGISVVRRHLPHQDRNWSRAIPITALPLTALYGAVALGMRGPAMLDRALQRTVSFDAVRLAHYRNLGCHGSRAAGELLQVAADGAAAISERLLLAAFRRADICGWRINAPVELPLFRVIPDVSFPIQKIAIEVDGWAWHHSPERFQRDRERQNALVNAGWLILRFTWFDVTERMDSVLRQVRTALGRRA